MMIAAFMDWSGSRAGIVWSALIDLGRAFAATGTIALAQVGLIPSGAEVGQEPLIIEGLRQGGLLAVILIVLFFYRRDYNKLTDFYKDQNAQMFSMVRDNTKAQADVASALAQNTVVVHQAKQVMSQHFPSRRDEDHEDRDRYR